MLKTLRHQKIYENLWIRVWEDELEFPDGKKDIIAYTERQDHGPLIIPLTKENKLVMIKEWRHPVRDWVYSFPFATAEEGESLLESAQEGLEDDLGYTASEWIDLGKIYIDPGTSNQIAKVFFAKGASKTSQPNSDITSESIMEIPFDEVKRMIREDEITNAWVLAGVLRATLHLS